MRSEWRACTLGDVLELQRGFDLPVHERRTGFVPVVASTGVVGRHDSAQVRGPGVVIGRSGSIGGGQYIAGDFWPLNTTLWVKDFKGNLPRYCYYLLRSIDFSKFNAGSGVPTLNRNHVHPLPTWLAPVREQHAIAEFLGGLDDRIDLLRQTNATLESIAQALFKSWFIDFDPVRAKQAGREPEGMDAATAALFPAEFEESALGWIPKGWRVATLAEAIELNPPCALPKGAEARYLEMANAPTSGHRPTNHVPLRAFGSGCKFRNGDALLAKITPCLENGKSAFIDFLDDDEVGWGSTEFIVMRAKSCLPEYGSYLLVRHEPFRQFAIQSMTGTSGRQRVEISRLAQFQMALPPDGSLARAAEPTLNALQARIKANDEQAKILAELRDTLLPRLISGKLRLPEAREQFDEATA